MPPACSSTAWSRINPTTLQPEADLADSWQAAPDSQGYRFTLRANISFHDGKPCTADDVKFTYELLLKDSVDAPRQADLAAVLEGVDVVSPTEVEFRLKGVFAPFLATHAGYGIVPKHVLSGVEPAKIEQSEFSLLRPVGAGPYRFKEWLRGSSLTLTRFDGAAGGQPYLDEIVLRVTPSQETLQNQLKVGEIDVGLIREQDVEEMGRQQNLTISRVDTPSFTYLGFQLDAARTALFQERPMRQALGARPRPRSDAPARSPRCRAHRRRLGAAALVGRRRPAGRPPRPTTRRAPRRCSTALGWRRGADGVREREGKKLTFELLANRGSGGNRVREQYALARPGGLEAARRGRQADAGRLPGGDQRACAARTSSTSIWRPSPSTSTPTSGCCGAPTPTRLASTPRATAIRRSTSC